MGASRISSKYAVALANPPALIVVSFGPSSLGSVVETVPILARTLDSAISRRRLRLSASAGIENYQGFRLSNETLDRSYSSRV